MRVAAFGWGEWDSLINLDTLVLRAVREAAVKGAKLLVTPEAAFQVADRAAFRRIFCDLAENHRIALAIGYFDTERNENCTDFISADGEIESRYFKTRLVPLFENYKRGNGEVAHLNLNGVRAGTLICQDDNFAMSAVRYARVQTHFLAIPTHDWRSIRDFHTVDAAWRGLEFRLGLVKAVSGGICFIASPHGEVLARCDHLRSGSQLLVADMPISSGKATLYARWRDYFPLACAFVLVIVLMLRDNT